MTFIWSRSHRYHFYIIHIIPLLNLLPYHSRFRKC
jgi:hypothetical protein